jgi:hypothetical protein
MENILYLFSWVKDVSIALLFDIPEVLVPCTIWLFQYGPFLVLTDLPCLCRKNKIEANAKPSAESGSS